MTDVHFSQPTTHTGIGHTHTRDLGTTHTGIGNDSAEMAAFEKGRMQGEMEAIRRMEADQGAMQLKQFPGDNTLGVGVAAVAQPDIIEINRQTWLQNIAGWVSQLCGLAAIVLTIVWIEQYRDGFGWSNDGTDAVGDRPMWNTGFLAGVLGEFCLGQAICNYRALPVSTPRRLNTMLYIFWQSLATVGFMIFLVALVRTPADSTFWGLDTWCYAAALFVWGTHMLYSIIRLLMPRRPVDYETWAETNNKITWNASAEQRRDQSVINGVGPSLYAPAPRTGVLGWMERLMNRRGKHHAGHAGTATTAAQAPVGTVGTAPRWSELPRTHADDYFLLPRAKWAVLGFVAMGMAGLMVLSAVQYSIASGRLLWPQGPVETVRPFSERSPHSDLISALGVISFVSILMCAYAAMPPRTTVFKSSNGLVTDRRTSISHNAPTVISQHDRVTHIV